MYQSSSIYTGNYINNVTGTMVAITDFTIYSLDATNDGSITMDGQRFTFEFNSQVLNSGASPVRSEQHSVEEE